MYRFLKLAMLALVVSSYAENAFCAFGQEPAQATASSVAQNAVQGLAQRPATTLHLGPGDLLHISVLSAPDLDRDVRVSDSGEIALPFVGNIVVAGLTLEQAQSVVEQSLKSGGFFVEPQVSIFVKEYATQGVSVLGEVQKPGIYPLLGPHTLFDAISAAGGTTPKAGKTVTITHRNSPQIPEAFEFSYDPQSAARTNVVVSPGDTVVMSKAGMVYVVGDVRQPTGIVLENPSITVLQAIAIAQGTNQTAALDKAKVIRKTPNGVSEIPVPLKKILSAKGSDLPLQAEDVLFVPSSLAKSAGRRTLEAALSTLSGIAIYSTRRY